MPVLLPDYDDRKWDDLVEEGRNLAVAWAPEWTDHNASDPGITLIELFAFLTETLIYRVNRISIRHVWLWLRLLNGPDWKRGKGNSLDDCIRSSLRGLNELDRAVTTQDFELLAQRVPGVGRAFCFPAGGASEADAVGAIEILIVPAGSPDRSSHELLHDVRRKLETYRLLGTRLHVRAPRYAEVRVAATLKTVPGSRASEIRRRAEGSLWKFFDPLTGGDQGRGWALGRSVYVSEVCQVLQNVPGVESVRRTIDPSTKRPVDFLAVAPEDAGRLKYNRLRDLESVELRPTELVRILLDPEFFLL